MGTTVDFGAAGADIDLEAAIGSGSSSGTHNNGLGSPMDVADCKGGGGEGRSVLTVAARVMQTGVVVMEESPLHEVLITAADRDRDQGRGRGSGSSDGGDRERTSADRLIRSSLQRPERERRPSATATERPSTKRELAAAW